MASIGIVGSYILAIACIVAGFVFQDMYILAVGLVFLLSTKIDMLSLQLEERANKDEEASRQPRQ